MLRRFFDFLPLEQPRGAAAACRPTTRRPHRAVARHAGAGQPEQALRHQGADPARSSTTATSSRCSPTTRKNIVVGFAPHRRALGRASSPTSRCVLAGCLDIDASIKAARFVRFCDAFNIPIVTFVDVPGFLPGTAQEYGGIIKHGAKLLYAYCRGDGAEGHGDHPQGLRRRLRRDELQAHARRRELRLADRRDRGDGAEGRGRDHLPRRARATRPKLAAREAEYREKFANPFIAGERGYIDDVIQPHETRQAHLPLARDAARQEARQNPLAQARQHPAVRRRPHVQEDPDRQPRRDRRARHPHRRELGIADRRRLLRSRPRRAARARSPTRPCCIGPAPSRESLPRDRHASSTPARRPAPRRSIPATASCPRTRRFARPRARRRASSSSARKPTSIARDGRQDRVARSWREKAERQHDPRLQRRDRRRRRTRSRSRATIGYPVMIKAAAGGGGKGMRVARDDTRGRARASRVPQRGAGQLRRRPRLHREVRRGAAPHRDPGARRRARQRASTCGERECSIQRRHQKVIEEAPSAVPRRRDAQRDGRAGGGAGAARSNYQSARHRRVRRRQATSSFYFLEMNTRAAGRAPGHRDDHRPRPGRADDPRRRRRAAAVHAGRDRAHGWAIECRINAEDPLRGFLPSHRRGSSRLPCRRAEPARRRPRRHRRLRGRRDPDPLRLDDRQADRLRRRPRRGDRARCARRSTRSSSAASRATSRSSRRCSRIRGSPPATSTPASSPRSIRGLRMRRRAARRSATFLVALAAAVDRACSRARRRHQRPAAGPRASQIGERLRRRRVDADGAITPHACAVDGRRRDYDVTIVGRRAACPIRHDAAAATSPSHGTLQRRAVPAQIERAGPRRCASRTRRAGRRPRAAPRAAELLALMPYKAPPDCSRFLLSPMPGLLVESRSRPARRSRPASGWR